MRGNLDEEWDDFYKTKRRVERWSKVAMVGAVIWILLMLTIVVIAIIIGVRFLIGDI